MAASAVAWTWYSWYMIVIYINAVLGLVLFEWNYKSLSRIRQMDSKFSHINKHFPIYRR